MLVIRQGESSIACGFAVISSAGFSNSVTLTASAPSGLTVSVDPSTVTFSSGAYQQSFFFVSSAASAHVGDYSVIVTGTGGGITHSAAMTVTVVSQLPAAEPFFSQLNWKNRVSLSDVSSSITPNRRSAPFEIFTVGISNPNNGIALFVNIEIFTVSINGGVISGTGTFQLGPGQHINNLFIGVPVSPNEVGTTITFTAQLQWDTVFRAPLTFTTSSSAQGVPTSGSFTVVP